MWRIVAFFPFSPRGPAGKNHNKTPHKQMSLDTFCSSRFAQEFTTELKNVLAQHEVPKVPKNDAKDPGTRVALDKLRCKH